MRISPYLAFTGNCEEAFKFYEQALGGRIALSLTYAETPSASDVAEDWQQKIVHARLEVGDQVIQGSDHPPQYAQAPGGFTITIDLLDSIEGERVFNALAEGGSITMPFSQTFWAHRFGMVVDRFGIPWMVNCQAPQ